MVATSGCGQLCCGSGGTRADITSAATVSVGDISAPPANYSNTRFYPNPQTFQKPRLTCLTCLVPMIIAFLGYLSRLKSCLTCLAQDGKWSKKAGPQDGRKSNGKTAKTGKTAETGLLKN